MSKLSEKYYTERIIKNIIWTSVTEICMYLYILCDKNNTSGLYIWNQSRNAMFESNIFTASVYLNTLYE